MEGRLDSIVRRFSPWSDSPEWWCDGEFMGVVGVVENRVPLSISCSVDMIRGRWNMDRNEFIHRECGNEEVVWSEEDSVIELWVGSRDRVEDDVTSDAMVCSWSRRDTAASSVSASALGFVGSLTRGAENTSDALDAAPNSVNRN